MVTVPLAMFSLLNSPVMRLLLLLAFELRPIYSGHSRLGQVYIYMHHSVSSSFLAEEDKCKIMLLIKGYTCSPYKIWQNM